ncbi:MAG: hypothetical protein R8G66_14215 [Cytophagales bacterium]|nr:hypothetical protein [Cytophagales bacterium]
MDTRGKLLMAGVMCFLNIALIAQTKQERSENIKALIKKNHLEDVEIVVHRLAKSNEFLNILLKNGHNVDVDNVKFKKKDVSVGEDIDIYVTHFSEHQSFTLLMLPVSFYNLSIYDTLLFASLEVSDEWLEDRFHQQIPSEEAKAKMLASETHTLLQEHIAYQADKHLDLTGMGEMQIQLHETYVSTSEVTTDLRGLSKEERELITSSWSLIKKSLSHNAHLNIESNVYVFGVDDMDVTFTSGNIQKHFKVTPTNIFERHEFSLINESDGQ